MGIVNPRETTKEEIGLMMLGAVPAKSAEFMPAGNVERQ
jgi:hypothetical protein